MSEAGGTGRRARFRFWWATVWVRVPRLAPVSDKDFFPLQREFFIYKTSIITIIFKIYTWRLIGLWNLMLKGLKEKIKIMDLTKGNIISTLIRFSMPMIFGNLFQQFYNIADTMIVGRFINSGALAAVGSSYSFITFINSIFIGLCMGSSIYFSNCFGAYEREKFKKAIYMHSFL